MNFWIDTHAHVYAADFDPDRADMLARSKQASVGKIYMPNIDRTSVDAMLDAEHRYGDQCVAMMGLHPCSVKGDFQKELYLVEEWLSKRKFAAIGEMGTDLYWDKTFWEEQKEAFTIQAGLAVQYQLPVVIHCRESMDQTIELLAALPGKKPGGIFHCFTGNADQAKKIIDMGFYLGLGGVATFKNGGLDKVIPDLGLESIVLETDSPYLAPVPHRGKRNEPSYIPGIAQKIADLKKISLTELQVATTANALKIFGDKVFG